jgi:hypothetical protein
MPMTKTQIYFQPEELRALHRIAKATGRPVAELVREAVRDKYLTMTPGDPRPGHAMIGLYRGPVPPGGSSAEHDSAFDEID